VVEASFYGSVDITTLSGVCSSGSSGAFTFDSVDYASTCTNSMTLSLSSTSNSEFRQEGIIIGCVIGGAVLAVLVLLCVVF
jgi:hypothetical protein